MPIVTLRHVVVGAAKADFVKHSIRVSLDLPLTDETLSLRSKLAFLAMEKESITVTLESAQLLLFDDAQSAPEHNVTASVDSVTLSANGNSVSMTGEQFHEAVERISDFTRDVLNGDESEIDATPRRKTRWGKKVERAERKQTKSARKNKK